MTWASIFFESLGVGVFMTAIFLLSMGTIEILGDQLLDWFYKHF